jgi:hypothetical protein
LISAMFTLLLFDSLDSRNDQPDCGPINSG